MPIIMGGVIASLAASLANEQNVKTSNMTQKIQEWTDNVKEFESQFADKGYKYLGWQLTFSNEDFKRCYDSGHMGGKPEGKKGCPTIVCNKVFSQRGSHDTNWCDVCKIWWNIDMSD